MVDPLERIGVSGERFGRAKKPEASEIVELRQRRAHPVTFDVASYYCQMLIHRAHVVMLVEQEILTKEEGSTILMGLREVEEAAKQDERLATYMSTEGALIERVGEVGGKMHIGRSRNDLGATQRRMFYRDQINRLIEALIEYQKALLEKAEENLETIMPGYTHWRQAQPITLGHYVMAHVDAAGRSVERLDDAYRRTNLNTLGAAALAGTGWEIDRNRTLELLGFDDLCENTYDCVAAHDFIIDLASAIAIHMSNLCRLAEDLQIWSSDEFAMIDLDESYAGTSSIMPQKKNPSSLEAVKLCAAESIGVLTTTISSVKGTSYTNIGDRAMIEPTAIETTIGCTKVMAGVVSTLVPMKDKMLSLASKGFSTMTELADTLVRSYGISFRQAHDIIGEATSKAISEGKAADQITVEMVEEAAQKSIGKSLKLPKETLQQAIDPTENIKRRKLIGGSAPEEVKRMIEDRRKKIESKETKHKQRLAKLKTVYGELQEAENKITGL